jgi:hypothetical protein
VQRVGVLLPSTFATSGEYLADVAALDAAGADWLCVQDSGTAAWVLLGAVAAVTHRARIAILAAGNVTTESLSALQRLSGGRAAVLDREETPPCLTFRDSEPPETWAEIAVPADRQAWRDALAASQEEGRAGVAVPWDPRLVDLLRNPEEDGDRSDLLMSTG